MFPKKVLNNFLRPALSCTLQNICLENTQSSSTQSPARPIKLIFIPNCLSCMNCTVVLHCLQKPLISKKVLLNFLDSQLGFWSNKSKFLERKKPTSQPTKPTKPTINSKPKLTAKLFLQLLRSPSQCYGEGPGGRENCSRNIH